jgi:hypothetical protein
VILQPGDDPKTGGMMAKALPMIVDCGAAQRKLLEANHGNLQSEGSVGYK